jgi:hypothetical protein
MKTLALIAATFVASIAFTAQSVRCDDCPAKPCRSNATCGTCICQLDEAPGAPPGEGICIR